MRSRLTAAAARLGLVRSDDPENGGPLPGVIPPSRQAASLTPRSALDISAVFRAVQIHAVAVSQLSLKVEREEPLEDTPGLIRKPDLDISRSAFLEQTTVDLATRGESFWIVTGRNGKGWPTSVRCLNPDIVGIERDRNGRTRYTVGNRPVPAKDIRHLALLRVGGELRGLGPIQTARVELEGAMKLRDYAGKWFDDAGVPSGVLSTEQQLAPGQGKEYKEAWKETHDGGVRVLGHGLTYKPIMLDPADAQFLENQNFTVTQIARMFGIPASLMLAAVEGNTQTYANVEQDWIAYVRFSLMAYLREIEEAFTSLLPHGQTCRFNIETLLRADTKTRYESYEIAIRNDWMTKEEVRKIEGLDK